jgi:hypothetical protein
MTISKLVYWPHTGLGIYKYTDSATIGLYRVFHISNNTFLNSDRQIIIWLLLFMAARAFRGTEGGGEM